MGCFRFLSFRVSPAVEQGSKTSNPATVTPAVEPTTATATSLFPGKVIIFVLGGPGSGKGTQCDKIIEKYGYTHLSVGDLLRDQVAKGTEIGKQVDQMMKDGLIVPLDITISLLREAMVSKAAANAASPGFLIDGFPREMEQVHEFEKTIAPCDRVLYFDCPLDLMQSRLLKRGESSGRADDNLATIQKRFQTFTEKSRPVIEHYAALGKTWTVSSEPAPDQVFAQVSGFLDQLPKQQQ